MVTRALGDGYLKAAAYSMPPFNRALPYITSKPKVTRVELDAASDAFVVVASDGVCPPPLPPRTDWTRLVPPPVLTGHV